jgi:hypothetical protein
MGSIPANHEDDLAYDLEWETLIETLGGARDLMVAILLTPVVEDALQRLIRTRLVATLTDADLAALFEAGPLSSLTARTRLGYALGLFGPRTRADLDRIQQVRNVFAHSWREATFESAEVAAAVDAFEPAATARRTGEPGAPAPGPRRERFIRRIFELNSQIREATVEAARALSADAGPD